MSIVSIPPEAIVMEQTSPSNGHKARNSSVNGNVKEVATPWPTVSEAEMLKLALLKAVTDIAETYRPVTMAHAAGMARKINADCDIDVAVSAAKVKMVEAISALPLPTTADEMEQRMLLLGKLAVTTRVNRVVTTTQIKVDENEDRVR